MSGPVIGIGAGGHARVVIDALRLMRVEIAGLLDPQPELHGTTLDGVPVLGDDSLLSSMFGRGIRTVFIGVGGAASTAVRRRLYQEAIGQGFDVITVIHPQSVISSTARIGRGATVLAGAIINAAAVLGDNVLVNTAAIVEHDCRLGDHVHVATGARLASTVAVGEAAHIGIGSTIRQCISIGACAVVGAGAVVVSDVPADVVVVGVPAKILKQHRKEHA